MEKKCYTCKDSELNEHQQPCCDCTEHKYWRLKVERDEKQLWLELTAMYLTALGNDEGIDEWYYEVMKDRFMNKLSEFKTAIIKEYEEDKE